MIHYQLRCGADHAFDGWFKSSDAFDRQAANGLVTCPECGDTRVQRALMAPAVAKRSLTIDAGSNAPVAQSAPEKAAVALPDKLIAALQRLRSEIERNSDYVGGGFAQEARKIHNGETERRSIYGESTDAEAEALAEDGIAFARIPWVPRADG